MKRGLFLALAFLFPVAAAVARPVKIVRDSSVLQFSYEWPGKAAAIPALDARFRRESDAAYRHALQLAREDHAQYRQQGRGSIRDFYSMKWTAAEQTARLLSLENQESTYTGGAHPNTSYNALLWDRKLDRPIAVTSVFAAPSSLSTLTRRTYCALLDRERGKRRNGETMAVREFDECPGDSKLAIAPVDRNRDGRFDGFDFVASPYVAGPYVEGEYRIFVPATAAIIRALKPGYRRSFEAHRQ